MARANPQRTGASAKDFTMTKPVISWRKYLGGALGSAQMAALDVDSNGAVEVVLISGGKLVAKQPDDTVVWETPPLALDTIQQIDDFDGDGQLDIVASGAAAFLGIFSAKTGALEWNVRDGTFGTVIGAVRVADVNHDGHPDLYAADNACGSVNGTHVSIAWSFAAGFHPDDGSQRLWQLPDNRDYQCGFNDVLADLDHDNKFELVAFSITTAFVYDAETGVALPASAASAGYPLGFSIPYGTARTALADVEGNGHLAIIGVTNNTYAPAINSRALMVLSFDRAQPDAQRLTVRWKHNVPDLVNDTHAFADQPVADLDADGKAEVLSTFIEAGITRASIFDGATGAVRSSMTGAVIRGVVTLAASERPTLLVNAQGTLQGYRFDAAIGADFGAPVFELPGRSLIEVRSAVSARTASLTSKVLTVPLPSGRLGLVVSTSTGYELWDTSDTKAPRATFAFPAEVSALSAAPQTGISGAGPGLLVARSDGYLIALDATLTPVNFTSGTAELSLPGIRTGGFYSGARDVGNAPVAGKLGRSAEEIVLLDSLGRLQRVDASHASLVKPPETVWVWPQARSPLLLDVDGDGVTDQVFGVVGADVVSKKPDFTEVFRVATGGSGWSPSGYLLPLAGTTPLRFALPQSNSGTGEGRVFALDSTGMKWTSPPIVTAGSGQGQLAADDLDGDGLDDAYGHFQGSLRAYAGTTGALLGSGAAVYPSSPMTVRGRAGTVTHIAAGSVGPMTGLSAAKPFTGFKTEWERPLTDRFSGGFAAAIGCPDGLVIGNSGYASSHLVLASAATGALRADLVLAGGTLFDSEAAASDAGVLLGNLGNANGTAGTAPTLLIGSTDGYLYALDPCAAPPALRWAVNLRAPVGEPILSDVDGDGADEVVVEVADGFIYGIDQEQFPAPASIIDTDESQPTVSGDVDETHAVRISASWAAVPNATGYQYAVFTAGGTALTRNPDVPGDPFIAVGATTTTASHADMLQRGSRYFFAVKALGASGASGERLSDGTRWSPADAGVVDAGVDAGAPGQLDAGSGADAGTGATKIGGQSKCGCSSWPASGAALALLWLGRRRRATQC